LIETYYSVIFKFNDVTLEMDLYMI